MELWGFLFVTGRYKLFKILTFWCYFKDSGTLNSLHNLLGGIATPLLRYRSDRSVGNDSFCIGSLWEILRIGDHLLTPPYLEASRLNHILLVDVFLEFPLLLNLFPLLESLGIPLLLASGSRDISASIAFFCGQSLPC